MACIAVLVFVCLSVVMYLPVVPTYPFRMFQTVRGNRVCGPPKKYVDFNCRMLSVSNDRSRATKLKNSSHIPRI